MADGEVTVVATRLNFPHAAQAIQIIRRRKPITAGHGKNKRWSSETVYAITSLAAFQITPEELADILRGHWLIEDRLHWVRDVTYDEDRSQVRTANGPRVHEQGIRQRLGVPQRTGPPLEATISPYLYLQPSTPAFEYPRRALPETVHWIGPLLPAPAPGPLPTWWPELDGELPVVMVTQGPVTTDAGDLIRPTLEVLANEPVLVVAVPVDGLSSAEIPANARVEKYVPFARLVPKVSALVTNGGYGGVQLALANGVPLVVAGTTEEKPEVAARVEWAGAGRRLKTKNPTPEQLRVNVRRILDEPSYRSNAQRIARDYAEHDAATEAVALLELLATTGRPVTRTAAVDVIRAARQPRSVADGLAQ